MTGQTCVITGATSGIGKSVALALGALGANLVLVGRNERAGGSILDRLRRMTRSATFDFIAADLSEQVEVRALAARIASSHRPVDILINNAGARLDAYRETSDGLEQTFAANHLGHFLLTCLLFPRLTPRGRIITVASAAHVGATGHGGWQMSRANYNRRLAYAQSKLANIMFAYELARRINGLGITSNAVDPGLVATNFARNNGLVPWLKHLVSHAIKRELVLPRTGAATVVYLAASTQIAGVTGKYFYRNHEVRSSEASYDVEQATGLWNLSADLTGLRKYIASDAWLFAS
jgi:NAD(P)-dependent dehydrogenase (short-subunit alcohol dehydrogenase family)